MHALKIFSLLHATPSKHRNVALNNTLPADTVIVKLVIVVVVLVSLSLAFRSDTMLTDRPIKEDAFYTFTVARNLAMGNGITIDGTNPTDGFQPLFTFLITPVFMATLPDRYEPIRFIIVIQWIMFLATAYLLGCIARDALREQRGASKRAVFWWVASLYLTSAGVFVTCFNGMETGLLLFCYALSWRYYQVIPLNTARATVLFGVLLGLTVLARIDAALFVALLSFAQLLPADGLGMRRRFRRFLLMSGTAFLVTLPWWCYNVLYFDSLMPTSGRAELRWMLSFERMSQSIASISQGVMPGVYFSQYPFEGLHAVAFRLALGGLVAFSLWKARHRLMPAMDSVDKDIQGVARRSVHFGIVLLVASMLLVILYTLSSKAYWFYGRYFSPLFLISCTAVGVFLYDLSKRFPVVAKATLVGLAVPVLAAVYFLRVGQFGSEYITEQLALVNAHVPHQSSVGAWQTGTLGYFRDCVVNLDGKVNYEALKSQHNLLQYVEQHKIEWVCDRERSFDRIATEQRMNAYGWQKFAREGQYVLYHRTYDRDQ
jgi:hypothetical protein